MCYSCHMDKWTKADIALQNCFIALAIASTIGLFAVACLT